MAALTAQVLDLRRHLEERFPDAQPVHAGSTGAAATGIGALDAALPAGGLPRGRVTLWRPGGGATAVLRSACRAVAGSGERAAWVDGAGVVAGAYWREPSDRLLLFRPPAPEASGCAEELLRSGGFALVVLGGVGGLGDGEGVRLGRAAREGGGAFVALTELAPLSHLRARSAFEVAGFQWRRGPFGEPVALEMVAVQVKLESMGLNRRARFRLPVEHHDARLSLEPCLVDRRGVVR
jgi:hypothetical protein